MNEKLEELKRDAALAEIAVIDAEMAMREARQRLELAQQKYEWTRGAALASRREYLAAFAERG